MFENYVDLTPGWVSFGISCFVCLLIYAPFAAIGVLIGHFVVYPVIVAVINQLTK